MLMRAVLGAEHLWPELRLFHAIPNGGHRARRTAARLKAEGVRAGVPDYCLPVARGGFHGLYIELKTNAGRLSPEQHQWMVALTSEGYLAVMCRGWAQAWNVVRDYLASEGEPHGSD